MKSEEVGTGLATYLERKGTMTKWWRWSGKLKGRDGWDDLGENDGPPGPTSWAQRKTSLFNERNLQFYAPLGGGEYQLTQPNLL